MGARIAGILLGALFAAFGYGAFAPKSAVGAYVAQLNFGPFEPHRAMVGAGFIALGAALVLSALLRRGPRAKGGNGGGGGGKRPPHSFDLEAALPVSDPAPDVPPAQSPPVQTPPAARPEPPLTLAAEPGPPPTRPPDPAPAAVALADQGESFDVVRTRLHSLARSEAWSEAAALVRRLPALASGDVEHAQAAQDAGDLARSAGRLDDAADAYHDALAYARAAHRTAPGEAVHVDLLAAALTNVGDVAADERRQDAAVEAYEEALKLRRGVVAAGRADPPALRALSLALERLADAREDRGHRMRALDLYKESLDIAGHLAAADPSRFGEDLAVTRRRLAELESRIAG